MSVSVTIAARTASSSHRAKTSISPATSSASLVIDGGPAQTYDLSAASSLCAVQANGDRQCTIGVNLAAGTHTFALQYYTGPNGTGTLLSQASASATIVAGQLNQVVLAASPVVSALAEALEDTGPVRGTARVEGLEVFGYDPAGYIATGGGNLPPVTVTDSDTSGATGLLLPTNGTCPATATSTATSVTVQGAGVTPLVCVAYTGSATLASATFTASVGGSVPTTSQTLTPHAASSTSGVPYVFYGDNQNGNVRAYAGNAQGSASPVYLYQANWTQFASDAAGDLFTLLGSPTTNFRGIVTPGSATVAKFAIGNTTSSQTVYSESNTFIQGSSLAVDAMGDAFVATDYLSEIAHGTTSAVKLATSGFPFGGSPLVGASADGSSLYLANAPQRYQANGGTYASVGGVNLPNAQSPFGVDSTGAVYAFGGTQGSALEVDVYPASAFAFGSTVDAVPVRRLLLGNATAISGAIDPTSDDLYLYVVRAPYGSAVEHYAPYASGSVAPLNYIAIPEAGTKIAVGGRVGSSTGPLTASPNPFTPNATGTYQLTISDPGYNGSIQLTTQGCSSRNTFSPTVGNGPTLTVTATVAGPDNCSIVFSDGFGRSVTVPFVATITQIVGT